MKISYPQTQEISFSQEVISKISDEFNTNIVGQANLFRKLLITLISEGHILLEGVPGLAKTRAIKIISKAIKGSFKRIQFTPDLLPSDIVGNLIFNPKDSEYCTKKGPIFANFVLADEVNRAPAKVQSALLESMQEKQVTLGDKTYKLPRPFVVLATQNPIEQEGTYPLPEAQIDRFLLKTIIEYPDEKDEIEIMNLVEHEKELVIAQVTTLEEIKKIQEIASRIYVDPKIKEYIRNIVFSTRYPEKYGLERLSSVISFGASPRSSIGFMKTSKASAIIAGRNHVIPEDIKDLAYDILRHRIILSYEAEADGVKQEHVIQEILKTVKVP